MVEYSQIKQQKELVKLEAQNLIDNVGHGLAYNFWNAREIAKEQLCKTKL